MRKDCFFNFVFLSVFLLGIGGCAAHKQSIRIAEKNISSSRIDELENKINDLSNKIYVRNTGQDDFLKVSKNFCFGVVLGVGVLILLLFLKRRSSGSGVKIFMMGALFFNFIAVSQAETIRLKNGDTLTGEILCETEEKISISHEVLGNIEIKKEFMKVAEKKETESLPVSKKGYEWQRKVSGGYSQSGGNTEVARGVLGFSATGKAHRDDWAGKINSEYASSQHKMNARKFYGLIRYAHSLEEKNKWYYFQKIEGDRDRFVNIDYRLTPSLGLGYWFTNTNSWKMMAESALGYEHTRFNNRTEDSNQAKLIPRFFLDKTLIKNLSFNQEFVTYLSGVGEYRFRSQSALINKINQHCDLVLRFLDEYNSMTSGTAVKNDYRLTSSIDYTF